MNSPEMIEWQWEPLDDQLAKLLVANETGDAALLQATVKILSHQVRHGHSCISLPESLVLLNQLGVGCENVERWSEQLLQNEAVGKPGDARPLILDQNGLLYFQRYWQYEDQLAQSLLQRIDLIPALPESAWLAEQLDFIYPADEQKLAAKNAICRNLCLISGGPGTGKTTTIAGLLTILLRWQPDLQIVLAAPTGKAAARMQQALYQATQKMALSDEEVSRLNLEAVTIHRLLGHQQGKPIFRHNASQPLPADVVVIDEASMIDLPLMSKLVMAVRPDARLILLGDRDQLASVEVGAVFGDIAADMDENRLRRNISVLTHSYRFDAAQGIGALARAINAGDADDAMRVLKDETLENIQWLDLNNGQRWKEILFSRIQEQVRQCRQLGNTIDKLQTLGHFQVLCAHRNGYYGVDGLTREIEAMLKQEGLQRFGHEWYEGRPVMVIENSYQTQLFNGDFGLALGQQEGGDRICFSAADERGFRCFTTARLPAHEVAWAITVHKSQGSEFDEVMLILPDMMSPVLTTELLYTAVTRARRKITIVGLEGVLRQSITRRIVRGSGLLQALS